MYDKKHFNIFIDFFDERKFFKFKRKYLKDSKYIMAYERLMKKQSNADVYIVGSDKVWGLWYRLDPYLLDFSRENNNKYHTLLILVGKRLI